MNSQLQIYRVPIFQWSLPHEMVFISIRVSKLRNHTWHILNLDIPYQIEHQLS